MATDRSKPPSVYNRRQSLAVMLSGSAVAAVVSASAKSVEHGVTDRTPSREGEGEISPHVRRYYELARF